MSLQAQNKPLNPIVRQLLFGIYDEASTLYALAGLRHVARIIWRTVQEQWKLCIETYDHEEDDRSVISAENHGLSFDPEEGRATGGRVKSVREIEFPKFQGININMMPFRMTWDFKGTKLPAYLEPYFELIKYCYYWLESEYQGKDKIGFLTVHESAVEPNSSQRRPGIHTEKGRKIYLAEDGDLVPQDLGGADAKQIERYIHWGMGYIMRRSRSIHGGIFMATTMGNSSEIWNCTIRDHPDGDEIIGDLGDISHLRNLLPEGETVEPNKIYWMTDRTPHESLRVADGGQRQFFRLVTHQVSVWYEDHSTPNPNGVKPDPAITKIVKGSKFTEVELKSFQTKKNCVVA